jgi:hypothetical protein
VFVSDAPLLSIIIVAYKSRDEIGACLESLPRTLTTVDGQQGDLEIVVIDNSTADPVERIEKIVRERFPHVRYLNPGSNLGFGKANNLGYRATRGGCVLFLNPDTVCNRAALEHCLRRACGEPALGVISPKLVLADGTMDLACRRGIPSLWDGFCRASGLAAAFPRTALFAGYNLTYLSENDTNDVGAINGAFMLGRREVFEKIALDGAVFDEKFFMYGDDLDLCIRVARAGWKIVYDGRVCITHLKGLSVAKDYEAMSRAIFDANREVYLKHFNPRGSRLVRWKYQYAFNLWKLMALLRAKRRGYRAVRPV